MKQSFAVSMLLMSSTQSKHIREMLQLKSEIKVSEQLNLGSLEGAYLSQKVKKKQSGEPFGWD
jgi:hypothetical protein